jgi:hypothetical protein
MNMKITEPWYTAHKRMLIFPIKVLIPCCYFSFNISCYKYEKFYFFSFSVSYYWISTRSRSQSSTFLTRNCDLWTELFNTLHMHFLPIYCAFINWRRSRKIHVPYISFLWCRILSSINGVNPLVIHEGFWSSVQPHTR